MRVSERSIFEKIGRLYVENKELQEQINWLQTEIERLQNEDIKQLQGENQRLIETVEQLRGALDGCQCLPATIEAEPQAVNGALEANKKPGA